MIIFNDEVYIYDKQTLDKFCYILQQEAFNEETRVGINQLIEYLHDCFIADEKLLTMTHKKIGEDVYPITLINFSDTSNLNEITFSIMSTDENREFTKRDDIIFNGICDICFGGIRGLFDRICSEIDG